MYKIIGSDQKEYGPVTSDQIRQWIAEGRINAQTQVRGDGDWKNLADFPEFRDLLSERPPLAGTPSPTVPQKTSGMAVTSLVLGILGIACGLTAIPGLILGIVSMVRIKGSGGRLGGWGIGLAGTILSGIFLLMVPLYAAMLLPALANAKQKAQSIACVNNVKQLGLAVRLYAEGHQNQFPPAATWCDAIQSMVGQDRVFQCPSADKTQRCHYAFNARVGGLDVSKVDPRTVLIFETEGGWNVSGGPELMLGHSRHARGFVVGLADGSVQRLTAAQLNRLRWDP